MKSTIALVIQCLVIFLISQQAIEFGSKMGNWIYPYYDYAPPLLILLATLWMLPLLLLQKRIGSALRQGGIKNEIFWVGITFIALSLMGFWARSLYPLSLAYIVESTNANGFYSAATHYTIPQFLSRFQALAAQFPSAHVQANMPGKTVFFQLLLIFTKNLGWMGLLIVVLSNLTALVLYCLSRVLFQKKEIAWVAMILYLVTPMRLSFLPILNTISPLLILLALLFLAVALTRRNTFSKPAIFAAFSSGIILCCQFFFDPLPFGLGLFFIAISWWSIKKPFTSHSIKSTLALLILVLSGFCTSAFAIFYLTGLNILEAFNYCVKEATQFNLNAARPYWVWIVENLKEYFLSAGAASSAFLIMGLFHLRHIKWHWQDSDTLAGILLLTFFLTVLILDFAGVNRGEISRLWIFLTPMQALLVGYICYQWNGKFAVSVVALGSFIQAAISLASVEFIG